MDNAFAVSHLVIESIEFKNLSLPARYLYIYLSKLSNRYADKNGWFWHSNRTLSDETKMDVRSIIKAKKSLQEKGFLKYKSTTFTDGSLKTTIYRLNHFLDISKYGDG